MRTGHLSGLFFLYICVAILCSIAEERNTLTTVTIVNGVATTPVSTLTSLFHPLDIYTWFGAVIEVATLHMHGTLWQGQWNWVWWLIVGSLFVGILEPLVTILFQTLGAIVGGALKAIFGLGR